MGSWPAAFAVPSELLSLLMGTIDEIVERLRANRARFGFTYITVLEPSMEAMGPVIAELRRGAH